MHDRSGVKWLCVCFLALKEQLDANRNQYTASFYAEPKQTWNYVNVRKDAYMFWWLYYTTAAKGYTSRPIVIWLQVCLLMMLERQTTLLIVRSTSVTVLVRVSLTSSLNQDDFKSQITVMLIKFTVIF